MRFEKTYIFENKSCLIRQLLGEFSDAWHFANPNTVDSLTFEALVAEQTLRIPVALHIVDGAMRLGEILDSKAGKLLFGQRVDVCDAAAVVLGVGPFARALVRVARQFNVRAVEPVTRLGDRQKFAPQARGGFGGRVGRVARRTVGAVFKLKVVVHAREADGA